MPKRKRDSRLRSSGNSFSLKNLAEHLGLAPATVSLVLNNSPVAGTISRETKAKILAAARELNYRPNFLARCLRTRRSFTIGVMVSEVSDGYNATLVSGIEDHLLREGYFYFVASHRFRSDLVDEYTELFLNRAVDGLIVVNTPWHRSLDIPVVTVSSHHSVRTATSIVLDHHSAAEIALEHLEKLGHRRIAFIKGQSFVPDTEVRWNAIVQVAARLGVPILAKLVTQLDDNSPKPDLGYKVTQKLLATGERFSALFAFNDISAIGAIRALHEFGLRVPEDVSVIGFDDIDSAAYHNPGLTTVRQPLRTMGSMAAEIVLRRLSGVNGENKAVASQVIVEPELIIRGTTSALSKSKVSQAISSASEEGCQSVGHPAVTISSIA
ncbi:MAG: LacI family DNA-binding transcriptional regulator [Acidobacteria bacterium]|nr:LacI family DNA-binding transcriptional regulator [Acidobacteriota bacterium]